MFENAPNDRKMDGLVTEQERDHGGGLDAAIARHGGERIGWLDLSTGINPTPYAPTPVTAGAWCALPDKGANAALIGAARRFWHVPDRAEIIAAPGASSLIAQIPTLHPAGRVTIPTPTYNEHAAAFAHHGWSVQTTGPAQAQVVVHPNNPDGRAWMHNNLPVSGAGLTVIDESFCDVMPEGSCIAAASLPGTLILKSFGKFWGLAGLRLGFAIGDPELIATLRERLGPWAVSGPALQIGTAALSDEKWAEKTRASLARDAEHLDRLMQAAGARTLGGTTLFRLYEVSDALEWQNKLAKHQIWTRVFPYNSQWLRLGLPPQDQWHRLEDALA